MKRKLIPLLCLLLLGGCFSEGRRDDIVTPDIRPRYSYSDTASPFESYSFNLSGEKNNYIATVSSDGKGGMKCVLENSDFETEEFFFSPPEGYSCILPESSANADRAVNVIRNDFDDTPIPDLIEVMFSKDDGKGGTLNAAKYFAPDNEGKLREIVIYDKTGETGTVISRYLDRIHPNHTEADKFIYEITVGDYTDDEGHLLTPEERVGIKTIAYDPMQFRFVIDYEMIHESNPLYFGYAYLAAANTAARYMTVELMPGFDRSDHIEMTDENGETVFYYSTGSKLKSMKNLRDTLCTVFSSTFADRLIENAPQCYIEKNGKLYSRENTLSPDTSYGILTFTDTEISKNSMLFRSRQEKYSESGSFTGYTDGGNFVISATPSGRWYVTEYRFPYL